MKKSDNLFTITDLQRSNGFNWRSDERLQPAFSGLSRQLVCPCCGSNNLHQSSAKVFFHDEGQPDDTRVFIKNGHVTQHFNGENPSPYRDGLRIQFDCEQCEGEPELALIQHKGSTFMYWHSSRMPLIPFDELDELQWTY